MFNGLKRRIARLPLVVLAGLALIILALPGVAGWFIANGVWDIGVAGAIVPYVLVALLFIFAGPIIEAVLAFLVYLSLAYLLVLIMHVILGSLHMSSYTGVGDFLFRNWDMVLLGAGCAALLVFKTFRGSSHPYRLQAPRQPGLEGAQMGERTEVYHTAPGASRFTIPRLALLAEEEE